MRRCWAGALLFVTVLTACGSNSLSLTEYVETINTIVDDAREEFLEFMADPEGQILTATAEELDNYTPQDLAAAIERVQVIEIAVLEAINALEPPEQVAELHEQWFDDQFTVAEAALGVRARTASSWEELSDTPEMAAYRAALARDKELCDTFQAELDATAARGAFSDAPWIPAELKEVVEAALSCGNYPDEPNDAYRPGAGATP